MTQFISSEVQRHFSPAASLAALGLHLQQIDLFGPVRETVRIVQKTVKHTPIDKLYDAFISILAGAHGLVEINTRLRSEAVLQRAFGRTACADQSVVQDTLNAAYHRAGDPILSGPDHDLSPAESGLSPRLHR